MLIIKIEGRVLTYDLRSGRWVCSDEVLQTAANNMLPEGRTSPSVVFLEEGGTEGMVLRHMKERWNLEVVTFEPEPPPPAEPGVVY